MTDTPEPLDPDETGDLGDEDSTATPSIDEKDA